MSVIIKQLQEYVFLETIDAGEIIIYNEAAWIVTEVNGVGLQEDLIYVINLDTLNGTLLEPTQVVQLAYFVKKELVVAPKGT